ncbi:MAG TPA: AsmA family protein [Methylotenera sp.]|nr:AsmA family protein [Methylotenera sp.]
MKKYKKILIGIAVVISLLIILPFLIPTQTYLNKAERIASEKLGVPVTIASGYWLILPSPRVVANDIAIGKDQEIKVAEVLVILTLSSLFSATKVVDLEVSKPFLKQAAIELISVLSSKKSEPSEAAAVNIRHVKIHELQFDWPDTKLPIINVEANLTNVNGLESAKLETKDGAVKADITPNGEEHLIVVNVEKWTLPVGLPVFIDQAKLEMHLKGSQLEIPNFDVALYNGKVTGNALISWEKNWRTNGKFKMANLSVKEPSSLVSKAVYLSGNLFGNGHFSSAAKDAVKLGDNVRADIKFKVNNGVLHGLDLVKAASLIIKQAQSGGATEFDELSGLLNVTGKQYHFRDLKISSGLLAGTGQVKVKPNKELDGVVEVEMKRSLGMTAIPLVVSGTVSHPVVLPSKAALAGAIAGTVILGPGVGTGLGIKAAGAIDKIKGLFDGK